MERKNSRYVFLKQNTSLWKHVFPDVFPDACLGFRFATCLRRVKDLEHKHVLWIPFCYLASGGSNISKKTRSWKQNTHI